MEHNQSNKDIFSVSSRRSAVLSVVIIIIVLIGIGFAYNRGWLHHQVIHSGLPAGYATASVPVGQYPTQLPKEFILYPSAQPIRGEVTTPAGASSSQVVTTFVVGDSPLFALNMYVTYLERNLWKNVASSTQATLWYTEYRKSNETIGITITAVDATHTQIQLNYMPGRVLAIDTSAMVKADYKISNDASPGFPEALVPTGAAPHPQYWKTDAQTGGIFMVDQSISGIAASYQKQVVAAGWTVLYKKITLDQALFSLSRTSGGSASVLVTKAPSGTGVIVSVRITK